LQKAKLPKERLNFHEVRKQKLEFSYFACSVVHLAQPIKAAMQRGVAVGVGDHVQAWSTRPWLASKTDAIIHTYLFSTVVFYRKHDIEATQTSTITQLDALSLEYLEADV